MNSPLLGMPFVKKMILYYIFTKICFALPDFTLNLNNISSSKSEQGNLTMATISKITILPNQQEIIECKLDKTHRSLQSIIGIIEPSLIFERKSGLCVMSSISKTDSNFRTKNGIINSQPYNVTVSPQT